MSRKLGQDDEGERLLSFETVCSLTSWSRPSIYRLMKADKFPKPVSLGDHRVAFKESDIQKYIASAPASKCGEAAADPLRTIT